DREQVAVQVDGAAAAAAGRTGAGRVRAVAHRRVVAEHAVEHHPGNADAAEGTAVGAHPAEPGTAAERAGHDVDGQAVVLAEHPDRGAAEVRSGRLAAVADEP